MREWAKFLNSYRSAIITLLTPMLCSPLLFDHGEAQSQTNCAFVVLLMGVYWGFEVLPLAITALIPLLLFPVLGIMKSEEVAASYLPDTSFLFIGGLMLALAVENSELHQRIALFVLATVGSRPQAIMGGIMVVSAGLSMFISNTATTALMVPIAQSVIRELAKNHRMQEMLSLTEQATANVRRRSVDMRRLSIPQEHVQSYKNFEHMLDAKEDKMARGYLISVCFASNIGGAATITGTASNLVLIGQMNKLFPDADTGINFLSWMAFAFPMTVCCLIFTWFVLCFLFLRNAPKGSAIITQKLKDNYERIPPVTFNEVAVTIMFFLMLGLWIFREPHFVDGFDVWFQKGFVTDATSAVFVVILLFIIPNKLPACFGKMRNGQYEIRESLLDWPQVQERFPWSVVLLLGGGFALAAGVKKSELSHEIGALMMLLGAFSPPTVMFIIICLTVLLTNICSNTVIASIFLPIVAELSKSLGTNPLYHMIPLAISCSLAFMLPVATPPNAIVFSAGIVQVKDMVIAGFLTTIGCVGIVMVTMIFWANYIFNLHEYPVWAYDENHPMSNDTLIQQLINNNKSIIA